MNNTIDNDLLAEINDENLQGEIVGGLDTIDYRTYITQSCTVQ